MVSSKIAEPGGAASKGILKARALKKGDTVGIIAPASALFEPGDIQFTYKWLDKLGLKYKPGKHLFDAWGDYAGTDEARLADLHELWADPEIKAILPARGGNGSARLLPNLNFDLIRQNPKIIAGYSDITGLLIAIHQQTGLVTFHGPTAGSFYRSNYTHDNYVRALMEPRAIGAIEDPEGSEWKPEYPPDRLVITAGQARGRLTGGCLTLIRQLMGTAYEIETRDRIVFLEDFMEEPHAIDRMLSHLLLAGKLSDAAGIIIGDCARCRPGDSGRQSLQLNLSVEQVLKERLGRLGIPVVYGMRLGHGGEQMTLPIGVMASLDLSVSGARFKILEAATL